MGSAPVDLRDELTCYRTLEALLHPDGLVCPRCGTRARLEVHSRRHSPALDYRCLRCRRVFNAWTGTLWQGTRCPPSELLGELLRMLDARARGSRPAESSPGPSGPDPLHPASPEDEVARGMILPTLSTDLERMQAL